MIPEAGSIHRLQCMDAVRPSCAKGAKKFRTFVPLGGCSFLTAELPGTPKSAAMAGLLARVQVVAISLALSPLAALQWYEKLAHPSLD